MINHLWYSLFVGLLLNDALVVFDVTCDGSYEVMAEKI